MDALKRVIATMQLGQNIVFSRSSARRLAEELILAIQPAEAKQSVLGNPVGAISFLKLANQYRKYISSDGFEFATNGNQDLRPFGELSSWLLTILNFNEQNWSSENVANDSFGF